MIPNIRLPKGFSASGVNSGVRRYRPDFGVVRSDRPCVAAGVYTTNTFKAACVTYNMAMLPSDSIRALVVNSGHANAATGEEGQQDNQQLAAKTARALDLDPSSMLTASTGVVGVRLPMDTLVGALPMLSRGFSENINNFALAIMTTDLVPKCASTTVKLSGGEITVTAAAKGSGMIHPNMATMLAFLFTDAKVEKDWFNGCFKKVADQTFNMISVDGETSTNDMFLGLANGASDVEIKTPADRALFEEALLDVSRRAAIAIARDGEGATKLITVHVKGAQDMKLAREAARLITTSPLIKSAIHGEDPNWGRIVVRLGQAGVPPEAFGKLSVSLQGIQVFKDSKPCAFDRAAARAALGTDSVVVEVSLGNGPHEATAWGCDLTKRYVEINTEYS
jgi:glutamate N-acetyltransferase/amino-acid N-acetyltransferase